MNVIPYKGDFELITIGMGPGEMLLEGIQEAIKQHDIKNGVVISGIGTFKTCRMHYIMHTDIPSDNAFYTLEKPLELTSVSGIIANYEPHLHITVTCGENEAYGGHLEPGSELAYLAEIVILKCNEHKLIRKKDGVGPSLLQADTD
ncbi:MAG: DNA-binding protein [Anaerolineae bacterium]|nr:DNA-binding protein [Anaerolineae bacterium]